MCPPPSQPYWDHVRARPKKQKQTEKTLEFMFRLCVFYIVLILISGGHHYRPSVAKEITLGSIPMLIVTFQTDTWCVFWWISVSINPTVPAAATHRCCTDLHFTPAWCAPPAVVLTACPPEVNSIFYLKQLDDSRSASGLSFTASHWPGQQRWCRQKPGQRNTAEAIRYSLFCYKFSLCPWVF